MVRQYLDSAEQSKSEGLQVVFVPVCQYDIIYLLKVINTSLLCFVVFFVSQVYNVIDLYGTDVEFPVDIDINMAKVMGVFLAQLR